MTHTRFFVPLLLASAVLLPLFPNPITRAQEPTGTSRGYYRFPAIYGDTVIFTSEGDLWRVPVSGGIAQRLTTHQSEENQAAISPDGSQVAFTASYEGPREAYVMPVTGGLPVRCTFEGGVSLAGWTPDGRLLYSTSRYSTLPAAQLCTVNPKTLQRTVVPLAQAADGAYSEDGKTLFFTRQPFQGSHAKRYKGGDVQNLWKFTTGEKEAVPLTGDFAGTSKVPMWWQGRVYFATDRDGVMNIWSMNPQGKDLKQQTHYTDYDVQSPRLQGGKIIYQQGADIRVLDLATGKDRLIPIRLATDFDQSREKWLTNPKDWTTAAHLSPDGKRIVLTARGQVFIAPVKSGRLVEASRKQGVRYRNARFLPDGKNLVVLSDESDEVELWKLSASGDGSAPAEQLTRDSKILRWDTAPSPDGKWIAHNDKNQNLWLFDMATKTNKLLVKSENGTPDDLVWSPDSRYLAFVQSAENDLGQLKLYEIETGKTVNLTTDRYTSYSPAFTPDGNYLYFLSNRRFASSVGSPWGQRQPEPYFDRQTQLYWLALKPGLRPPFKPDDELTDETKPDEKKPEEKKPEDKPRVEVVESGLTARIGLVGIPAGNYSDLTISGKRLFFISGQSGSPPSLVSIEIKNDAPKLDTIQENVGGYELSGDSKKILARIGADWHVFDATGAKPNLTETRVNLDSWTFALNPREEWRQMFNEAWRLHRDYLYDPEMHKVDWKAMRAKYRPLAERVANRGELSDAIAQMIGELNLLHASVGGGDQRFGPENIGVASLGAAWERDEAAGGYRISRLYQTDPDEPEVRSPLTAPGVDVNKGDVIERINGVSVLSVPDAATLLRTQSGKQVRLRVFTGGDKAKAREVIVTPVSLGQEFDLRYRDWEYSRRLLVDQAGEGKLGYVHLRAMGSGDINQWQRDYYPIFNRQGLIIDFRNNRGGNIDSWILEKLLRKVWMYWKPRVGNPYWNMQYAFRGPMVVLCDQDTASDGEAVSEGFRRLGLGKVIGTRTWGGEVWLTGSNTLVDNGIATAAEIGVYGPEGSWLIEGQGVEPDIIVDNLPHATFNGEDAQLMAAIKHLQEEIKKKPVILPPTPKYPDKSFIPKANKP